MVDTMHTRGAAEMFEHMESFGTRFYPYVFAGIRRSAFRYRAKFNQRTHVPGYSLKLKGGRQGLKFTKPNAGGAEHQFLLTTYPKDEKEGGGTLDDIRVELFTHSYVAEAWEFGTTIKPERGRWVAIPAGYALGPKGGVKKAFRNPSAARRAGYELFYIPRRGTRGPFLALDANAPKVPPTKRGNEGALSAFLAHMEPDVRPRFRNRRKKRRVRIAFVLVPKVVLEARLGLYDGWDRFRDERDKRLSQEFRRYMREQWDMVA